MEINFLNLQHWAAVSLITRSAKIIKANANELILLSHWSNYIYFYFL